MAAYNESGTYIGMPSDGSRVIDGYAPNIGTGAMSGSHGTAADYKPTEQYVDKPIYTEAMISALYGASKQVVAAKQQLLFNMGYLTPSSDYRRGTMTESIEDEFRAAMGDANRAGLTLEELYNRIRAGVMKSGAPGMGSSGGGSAPYTGPSTTTSTSDVNTTQENVSLTGRGSARMLMIQALAQEIGREPTNKEVGRFLRALNKEERANPSISRTTGSTTTTTTTDPDPKSHSTEVSSSTTGGTTTVTKASKVDPGAEADKFAEKVAPKEESRFEGAGFMEVIATMLGM